MKHEVMDDPIVSHPLHMQYCISNFMLASPPHAYLSLCYQPSYHICIFLRVMLYELCFCLAPSEYVEEGGDGNGVGHLPTTLCLHTLHPRSFGDNHHFDPRPTRLGSLVVDDAIFVENCDCSCPNLTSVEFLICPNMVVPVAMITRLEALTTSVSRSNLICCGIPNSSSCS